MHIFDLGKTFFKTLHMFFHRLCMCPLKLASHSVWTHHNSQATTGRVFNSMWNLALWDAGRHHICNIHAFYTSIVIFLLFSLFSPRPRWVVPVLPKGELEVLLEAAIDLSKKGRNIQNLARLSKQNIHVVLIIGSSSVI